jgi:hypothetical protein
MYEVTTLWNVTPCCFVEILTLLQNISELLSDLTASPFQNTASHHHENLKLSPLMDFKIIIIYKILINNLPNTPHSDRFDNNQ